MPRASGRESSEMRRDPGSAPDGASLKRLVSPTYLAHVVRYEAGLATSELRTRRRLTRILGGERPVVAGPWCSEIGFELLYWIPFLREVLARHGVDSERVIAVSRGGAGPWYREVAGGYVDLLDHFEERELKRWLTERVESSRTQKQTSVGAFERHFLDRAGAALGDDAVLLHPSTMYGLFMPFWAGRRSVDAVRDWTRFEPLSHAVTDGGALRSELPDEYVAVKAYFSKPFPDTGENRAFLRRLLDSLTESGDVVLLSSGADVDEHTEYQGADVRVHMIGDLMTPANNLAVQTQAIAGARALVATYGGFSYLGPLLGTPTLSFHSTDNFKPAHLEVMHWLLKSLRSREQAATFVHAHVRDFPLFALVGSRGAAWTRG
jgi:hypothetical protein